MWRYPFIEFFSKSFGSFIAGNSWGKCPDGTGKLGCGDQETFRGCSDVAIKGNGKVSNFKSNSAAPSASMATGFLKVHEQHNIAPADDLRLSANLVIPTTPSIAVVSPLRAVMQSSNMPQVKPVDDQRWTSNSLVTTTSKPTAAIHVRRVFHRNPIVNTNPNEDLRSVSYRPSTRSSTPIAVSPVRRTVIHRTPNGRAPSRSSSWSTSTTKIVNARSSKRPSFWREETTPPARGRFSRHGQIRKSSARLVTVPPQTGTCRASEQGRQYAGMDDWCKMNCKRGFCPTFYCTCERPLNDAAQCRGTGIWGNYPGMDAWCVKNCELGPPFCPKSHCIC